MDTTTTTSSIAATGLRDRPGFSTLDPDVDDFAEIINSLDELCGHNRLPGATVTVASNCAEPAEALFTGHGTRLRIAPELADPGMREQTRIWILARALAHRQIGPRPWYCRVLRRNGRHLAATAALLLALGGLTGHLPVWATILGQVAVLGVAAAAAAAMRRIEHRVDDLAADLITGTYDRSLLDPDTARELDTRTGPADPCWWPWRTHPSPRQRLERYGPPDRPEPGPPETGTGPAAGELR